MKNLSTNQKIKEYVRAIIRLRRNITASDNIKFSDKTDMHSWIAKQKWQLNSLKEEQLSKEEYMLKKIFERVNNILIKSELNEYRKKVNQYLIKINELGNNIDKENTYFFNDGTDMYLWYKDQINRLSYEREANKIPNSKRLEEIMMFSKIDDRLLELEFIEYENKINEYIKTIREKKQNIRHRDGDKFSDGKYMYDFYKHNNNKIKKEIENNAKLSKRRLAEIQLFANIDNELYDIKKRKEEKNEDKKPTQMQIYEKRVLEYINVIEKLRRNVNDEDDIKFTDGSDMYLWYKFECKKLTNEKLAKRIPDSKRLEEIMMFSKIEDKLFELKFIEYENKVNEYIKTIKKKNRNIILKDTDKFNDGQYMYDFYKSNNNKIKREIQNNARLSNRRFGEIQLFANIDNELHDIKKRIEQKKKNFSSIQIYENRVYEYISQIRILKRNVADVDNIRFTDGTFMFNWFRSQNSKFFKYRKDNKSLNCEEIEEIMLFAKIHDELFKIKNDRIDEKLSYKEKINEYVKAIIHLRRDITASDNIKFSDGTYIYNWKSAERINIRKIKEKDQISEEEKAKIEIFERIDETLLRCELNKFIKKINEYLQLCKKLNRKIKRSDDIKFSDGTDAYRWYESERAKINKRMKNQKLLKYDEEKKLLLKKISEYMNN